MQKKELKTKTEIATFYPELVEIWSEVFTPIIGAKQVAYMLHVYQSKENIAAEIASGVHYYALYLDESCVGYTAYALKSDYLYISKLYIKAAYRGQGYMREIFTWYDELSQKYGLDQQLRVNQHNERAIAVYEHLGFEQVATDVADIGNGFVMDDYIYRKKLVIK